MSKIFAYIVPVIFFCSFTFALVKRVRVYDSFTEGIKGAIPLVVSVFPYLAAVTMLTKLLEISGLSAQIAEWLAPLFRFTGIPQEIATLLLVRPFGKWFDSGAERNFRNVRRRQLRCPLRLRGVRFFGNDFLRGRSVLFGYQAQEIYRRFDNFACVVYRFRDFLLLLV